MCFKLVIYKNYTEMAARSTEHKMAARSKEHKMAAWSREPKTKWKFRDLIFCCAKKPVGRNDV
jgi:uncharacterized membrane protein